MNGMLTLGRGVVQWVEQQLGASFGEHAQGIGWQRGGEIICGAVYEGYNGANVYVHIAKMHGVKFPAAFIAAFVDYPFNQLRVRRMSAMIPSINEPSQEFAQKLGATLEGRMPEAVENGDLLVFGLLRRDAAKWLSEPYQRRLGEFHGRSSNRDDRGNVGPRRRRQIEAAACA